MKKNKILKKILLNSIIFVLFTVIILSVFIYIRIRISFPERKGVIKIKGLKDKVFVYFDKYGIPSIEAKYIDDAIFAIGYLHAQDRMFQMDLLRRVAFGELSEIFGEKTFKVDSFFRVLGIKRIAKEQTEALLPIEKRILEDYVRGVNAYIERRKGQLPFEFLLLNYKPKKWKIEHTIAIGKLISWDLNLSFKGDLLYTQIRRKLDSSEFKNLLPFYPADAPMQIESIEEIEKTLELLERVEKYVPKFYASNSFAVKNPPLLENDPHLDLTIPANWYLISINCDSLKATGFTIPGVPLPVSGTNWRIAIGITSLQLDDGDFVISDLNDLETITEVIKIKGREDRKINIYLKDGMPLIDRKNKLFYFWRSSLISHEILSLFKLYNSENVYQADSALSYFRSPALNFVIVDKDSNLLYRACGWIEERKDISILPRNKKPEKFLPDSLLPKIINPKSGYVASCNNPPSRNFPYYISLYFSPSGRARRLNELLRKSSDFDFKKFIEISRDVKDIYAEIITNKITDVIKNIPMDEKEKGIFEKLKNFDFYMRKKKDEPLIFYNLIYRIMKNYYRKILGDELYKKFISFAYIPLSVLENNLRDKKIDEYYIIKSFREMCEQYKKETYGKYHKVKFKHPLSEAKIIGRIFRLKELPADGSLTTINKMGFKLENPYDVIEGPSMRMIVDLENKNFYYVLPPGESGVIFDGNYYNQIELWLSGSYISLFPFEAKSRLILSP